MKPDIEIITPQFDRTDGLLVTIPDDFKELHLLSVETLVQIGCQRWNKPDKNGYMLWLFPAEWYDHIPDGLQIMTISDNIETFQKGETDNDKRFGALAYGFKRKE